MKIKFNENTSMEPRTYEILQTLVDEIVQHDNSARGLYRAQIDGALSVYHALTGDIWTRKPRLGFTYIENENGTERIIPTALKSLFEGGDDE